MSEPLSFDDAQILRLESDSIKGHTGKLVVLDPREGQRIELDAIRDRVGERIGSLERLGQRVEEPKGETPRWVDAASPDLDWHIADAGPDELSDERFRLLAGELFAERLDHERPLWRFDVAPLSGGRAGLIGRMHHAMVDGVSAIRMLSGLFWDEASSAASSASRPGAARGPASEPEPTRKRSLFRLGGAFRRELRPRADTALDRHIGSARELAWRRFPLERLKRIEHSVEGATVNDVVLAAVAGALRGWMGSGEGAPAVLRAQIPVSLHSREEGAGQLGNRDSFLNIDLPLDEPDATGRLRVISAETRERKLDHDAETMYSFFHALGRFRPLYRGVTRLTSGPREFALSISNVPGPRERPSVLGHPVSEFCSVSEPADRHALRVSIISLGGDLTFGFCSDPEAVADLPALADALEVSVDELDSG